MSCVASALPANSRRRSPADQFGKRAAAAGVDDGRPADEQRLAARLRDCEQFLGDLADGHSLGLFGRDVLSMNSNVWRSAELLVRETRARRHGRRRTACPARRRSSARSGPCATPGRRRCRNPSPGRPPRSSGRPGGLRSAGWSCCKSLRERPRPCRPRTSWQSCCDDGHGPVVGDLAQDLGQHDRRLRPALRPGRSWGRIGPGRS